VDYFSAATVHGPALAYKLAIEALHEDSEVDGLIVHLFAGFGVWHLDMKEIMSDIKRPTKPILFWLMGPEPGREVSRLTLEKEGWPTFSEIHRTVRVMASLFEQDKYTNKSSEIRSFEFPMTPLLKELTQQANERGESVLDEHEAKKWLQALDLKVVKEVIAKDLGQAVSAAKEMGYPVVLKGRVEGQIHKTDAGLVKLNLWTDEQFKSAYQEMSNLRPKPQSFQIQPMLKGDLELIVGIIRDPQFGPAAMLGLGGIWTEVYRDVAFRLIPLNQQDVFEMVSELKGKDLFRGYRGSKPLNMEALAEWLIRLGWLAMKFEKIQEIDVNPLLIVEGEPVAVDATIILRGSPSFS